MKIKLILLAVILGLVAALCVASYYLGKQNAEIKIVKEQVEVVRYVDQKKADIYSKPPAGAADIFKLMRKGLF